ncbi:MAG TPA: WYL domain-containing protein, partial [Bacteroidia bacterium]|nr:WYL domain-containing protein [Bacteroidia bacterium]
DQKFYNGFVSQKILKDKIEMTFLTSSIEGFARWYMMFGDRAEIISPNEVKARVKQITAVISKKVK